MGYLSQKKYRLRERIFFISATVFMALVTGALLLNSEFSICGLNLFHFYCISWILFIGAVIAKKIVVSLFLGIVLVVNYVLLAMSANIFFSDTVKGDYQINISYDNIVKYNKPLSKGVLMLGQTSFAEYAVVNEEAPIMVIKVDLSLVDKSKRSLVFQSLNNFLMKQEVELVVLGNFEMPAWAKEFRDFIDISGLSVKNRLVFNKFLQVSSFYILGYNNVGVARITKSEADIETVIDYSIL